MRELIDSIKRGLGMFDSGGLRFHVNHLSNVVRDAHTFSDEHLAKYVDVVTHRLVNNNIDWIEVHFPEKINVSDLVQYNMTALGNLAYIKLYSYNNENREKAGNLLENYRYHRKK